MLNPRFLNGLCCSSELTPLDGRAIVWMYVEMKLQPEIADEVQSSESMRPRVHQAHALQTVPGRDAAVRALPHTRSDRTERLADGTTSSFLAAEATYFCTQLQLDPSIALLNLKMPGFCLVFVVAYFSAEVRLHVLSRCGNGALQHNRHPSAQNRSSLLLLLCPSSSGGSIPDTLSRL